VNIKTLRVFLAVVRTGSLSAAARALGISQPAVTKQLQTLEDQLGLDLVTRGHAGVVGLTPAGLLLRDYAQKTTSDHEIFLAQLRALKGSNRGEISIAASTTPGDFILPALLLAFHERYPTIVVQMSIANTATVAEQVLSGRSDVGFVGAPIHDPRLTSEVFAHDDIVLAVPAQHPLANRPSIELQELFAHSLILREPGSGTREAIERALSEEHRRHLQQATALELGSPHAVLSAILDGAGIGFISGRTMETHAPQGICIVPVQGLRLQRDLHIVYRKDRPVVPALQTFLDFARVWDQSP
jgi:DNA-binding transcriptional LysR family regulator